MNLIDRATDSHQYDMDDVNWIIWTGKNQAMKDFFFDVLDKEVDCKDVLDIGCGTGWLLQRMSEIGANAEGVEPSNKNVEIAKEARKLQETLSKVEKDFSFFYNNFEDIGKSLDKAAKSYNTGRGQVQRFKKNLDAALKFEITQENDAQQKALPDK